MRNNWNDTENRDLVSLYFTMLGHVHKAEKYNKAAMIRAAQAAGLSARSRGSIEAKLMNVSAVLRDLAPSLETMDSHGYKCAPNYQKSLKDAVVAYVLEHNVALAA